MSQASTPSTAVLRAASATVLAISLAATALQAIVAANAISRADPVALIAPRFVPAALTLMAGVGLFAVVEGIARVVSKPAAGPAESVGEGDGSAIERLATAVTELRAALPQLLAERQPAPPSAPMFADQPILADNEVSVQSVPRPEPESPLYAEAPVETAPPVTTEAQLERIVRLLEEMKELSLLDESQRQARGQLSKQRKKLERVDEAAALIASNEWEQADALLTLLESLHPGDPDVLARRNELDDIRTATREAEWAQRVRHVEDLLALSRFDDAAAVVAEFREWYPTHVDAAGLSAQIVSDREAHIERGAAALFNEIKTAVDARQWRMALDGTQRFLNRYPDNVRSDRIRQQVRSIQRNAEIEERHENENQIKDLARAGRFAEAADLCEQMLTRFPDSSQVATLQNLLPRLRERSAMAEAAVE